MNCRHLTKRSHMTCRALEKRYVPSLFQLVEYCRSDEFRKCPLYLRGILADAGGTPAPSVFPKD